MIMFTNLNSPKMKISALMYVFLLQVVSLASAKGNQHRSDKYHKDRSFIFGGMRFGEGYDPDWAPGTSHHRYTFWPLSWPVSNDVTPGYAGYLDVQDKYGDSSNPDRKGGPMTVLFLTADSTNLAVVADQYTTEQLSLSIAANCTSFVSESFLSNVTDSIKTYEGIPRPENVLQYYRSSSIALASSGYINNATYSAPGTPDTEVPQLFGLQCFNQTIGNTAPLSIEMKGIDGVKIAGVILSVLVGMAFMILGTLYCYRSYLKKKVQKKRDMVPLF
ncbi:hypothetical protein JR316_0008655 [Psilocybe cubensis]|uniref:Uncharacterized protein n=2 Tax=Psilocybe cubensis TaxID=181762 RepID=A0ACB8GS07_PSICU|nr:hypothetical protein JR316_0008655 [Psilocybe cubensis]KAH9478202.1 hypothetical protein JR316_0008655 [Psilocybe cubensis]